MEKKAEVLLSVKRSPRYGFYLFVDSGHDGCADFHSQHEAALEVLLQEQRLQESHQEQQHRVQVALPVVAGLVLGEGDHQPGQEKRPHLSEPGPIAPLQSESCLRFSFPRRFLSDTGGVCAEQ